GRGGCGDVGWLETTMERKWRLLEMLVRVRQRLQGDDGGDGGMVSRVDGVEVVRGDEGEGEVVVVMTVGCG
nr:hypothetical protein [Tanacetum cinerariifolium]